MFGETTDYNEKKVFKRGESERYLCILIAFKNESQHSRCYKLTILLL
jgi:hypothetical protein